MNEHTPGPWKWESDSLVGEDQIVLYIGEGYDGLWGGTHPNVEDARLIAAAPDLLAMLECLLERYGDDWAEGHQDLTRAAIAHARGVYSVSRA